MLPLVSLGFFSQEIPFSSALSLDLSLFSRFAITWYPAVLVRVAVCLELFADEDCWIV